MHRDRVSQSQRERDEKREKKIPIEKGEKNGKRVIAKKKMRIGRLN